ncbi:MAG: hypothetical protein GF331_03205 [Chitinivibrionales bacterium]|nr:hypothetical protein [Chitinivibrionales bacterium]
MTDIITSAFQVTANHFLSLLQIICATSLPLLNALGTPPPGSTHWPIMKKFFRPGNSLLNMFSLAQPGLHCVRRRCVDVVAVHLQQPAESSTASGAFLYPTLSLKIHHDAAYFQ